MGWANWKRFEAQTAVALGGMRRVRIRYSESIEDVHHILYSIECKYGKSIPNKALKGKQCKFLDRAWEQAVGYNPDKIPLVCLKRPRMRGFIIISDYSNGCGVVTRFPRSLS